MHNGSCILREALYSLAMQHAGGGPKPPHCGPFTRATRLEHLGARLTQGRRFGAARKAFRRSDELARGATKEQLKRLAREREQLTRHPSGGGDDDSDVV